MIPFDTINQLRSLAHKLTDQERLEEARALASAISDVVEATNAADFYASAPYGVCPVCGECEALLRIDNKTYGLCHKDRRFWYVGAYVHAVQKNLGIPLNLGTTLPETYTQVAISEVFPTPVCPCCGKFRTHASWCIAPLPALYKS